MKETQRRMIRLAILRPLWRRHGWLLIGVLWVVALVLAYLGFRDLAPRAGRSDRFFDVAYRVIQLIPMNSGDVDGAGWPLDAGRFLIPFLAALTALRALLSLFRDRWQQFLLRFWRDHVIVCGLSRKGWLLVQGFAVRGDRVVVIEADEFHALIDPCRERGIVVLAGDATDPDLLRRAGVPRARHLIAVTDDDGVNAEIAVRSQGMLRKAVAPGRPVSPGRHGHGQGGALTCTVHVVDPQLYELARTHALALEEGVPLRLELFNVFERGARLLWSRYGPLRGSDGLAQAGKGQQASCSAHVLVIGLGRLGESLTVTAARDWHTRLSETPCGAAGRLRVTVVDLEADWKCRALNLRYPQLAGVCDLVPLVMNVRWPEFYQGTFLGAGTGSPADPAPPDQAASPPLSAVFVCFDDDSLGLRTALAVHQLLLHEASAPVPIVVRMAEAGGLARLVDAAGDASAAFANIHAFALLDHTCTPEAILGGTHEVLARGLHEAYCQQQATLGQTAATNPSLVEWEALPDTLRESNRAQADALFRDLAGRWYMLAPLADWGAAAFRFPPAEIERMAESEHDRFVAERLRQGWHHTDGPKDIWAKLSPALVPWAELPEDERTKTCDTVRELPASLARAGFQIIHVPGAGGPN